MNMFNSDIRAYRKLLSADLKYAPFYGDSFWTRYMGFVGSKGNYPQSVALGSSETKRLTATGKPIEVLTNFMDEPGDTMEIPLQNPLTDQPLYDTQLLNNEEEPKLTYMTVHTHIFRKGVVLRDSKVSEQVLKKIAKKLMGQSQANLKDYFRRLIGYQPYLALLEKYSANLTAAKAVSGGLGLTPVLHPNFFVAGTTKPTWSETPATYATNVANALATLTDTASKRMSAEMVKKMVREASLLKIRPATNINGTLLYDIVMSEAAAYDLSKDTEFQTAFNYAYMGAQDKSKLNYGQIDGTVFFNALIHVDQTIPDAKITGDTGFDSSKTVSFGNYNTYMANPISAGQRKLAILFGASAVGCGYAAPLSFEQENWDYKYKLTEGADMYIGFERADILDFDGKYGTAGYLKENASSLVVAHWADNNTVTF